MDLPDAVRPSCIEKHTLGRRGFTRVDVSHDADVAAAI
jgi:hypothetical protein